MGENFANYVFDKGLIYKERIPLNGRRGIESTFFQRRYTNHQDSSFAQSCPTLRPHALQHARLPCPSPTPRVRACLNSCPLSWWCHPTISFSVSPTPFLLSIFPSIGVFHIFFFFFMYVWYNTSMKILKLFMGQNQGHLITKSLFRFIFLNCMRVWREYFLGPKMLILQLLI